MISGDLIIPGKKVIVVKVRMEQMQEHILIGRSEIIIGIAGKGVNDCPGSFR
jgi:hypothetical protein